MNDPSPRQRRLMSCLGDPSRFGIARRLLGGEHCVTELAREVGLSQSCTTRHLQALQREGIVRGVRAGKRVLFSLCMGEPQVRSLMEWAVSARASAIPAPRRALRRAHGADLHTEGPARPARRAPAPAPFVPPAPPAGPTAESEPIAPRRAPRQELEDFLL